MATLLPFAYNVVDDCVLVLGLLLFVNLFTNIRRHFVFFASKAPLLHEIHASFIQSFAFSRQYEFKVVL